MAVFRTNKRGRVKTNRATMHRATTRPPSAAQEEEYDRAVAFLREFRARKLVVAPPHSASLDAVAGVNLPLDADARLALAFSRGLSVAGRRQLQRHLLRRSDGGVGGGPGGGALRRDGRARLRKAATSQCLSDLDGGGSDGEERTLAAGPRSPFSAPGGPRWRSGACDARTAAASAEGAAAGGCYSLGDDDDDGGDGDGFLPATKRHRSARLSLGAGAPCLTPPSSRNDDAPPAGGRRLRRAQEL